MGTMSHAIDAESFLVKFKTDVPGDIVLNITHEWAPLGVDHLKTLIKDGFYNSPAAFFRVVRGFVVQFGLSGDPATNKKWEAPIKDDKVLKSNVRGTISYATAGPNTRATQFFINTGDNERLDSMGFAPLGTVVSGMDVVDKIYNPTPGSSSGVDQDAYTTQGQSWIKEHYPKVNSIVSAQIESSFATLV